MSIEKARKHTVFRAFLFIKTYYLFYVIFVIPLIKLRD